MRGVDQRIDPLAIEIIGKPGHAAEAAAADRHRLRHGRSGTAGERQRNVEIGARGEAFGQEPRFRRAAENEDAWHAYF